MKNLINKIRPKDVITLGDVSPQPAAKTTNGSLKQAIYIASSVALAAAMGTHVSANALPQPRRRHHQARQQQQSVIDAIDGL